MIKHLHKIVHQYKTISFIWLCIEHSLYCHCFHAMLQAANYDFYVKLGESCCGKLERYKFPSFEPSTSNSIAAGVGEGDLGPPVTKVKSPSQVRTVDKESVSSIASKGDTMSTQGMANLSLALSLGNNFDTI